MSNYDDLLFVDREKKYRGFLKLLQPETRQAVMLIKAPKDYGKSWLARKMLSYCRQPDVSIPVALIDFRNPRERHAIQNSLGLILRLRDRLDQDTYFEALSATIALFAETQQPGTDGALGRLRQNIERYFDLSEIKTICFDIGVRYDNLAGDTLATKSRSLVDFCQRRQLLTLLIEQCQRLRSQIDWWQGFEGLRDAQAPTADPVAALNFESSRQFLRFDSEVERKRAERQMNDAFFAGLASLTREKGLVLLIDSYEEAPTESGIWIRDELMTRIRDGLLGEAVVVVSGREIPDLTDLKMKPLVVQTGLDPFDEQYVREYFEERRQIAGLDLRTITLTSGGVPGTLAIMADHALAMQQPDDDFFSDL